MKLLNCFVMIILLAGLVSAVDVSMVIILDQEQEKLSVAEVNLVADVGSNRYFFDSEYVAVVSSLSGEEYKVNMSFPGDILIDSPDPSFVPPLKQEIQPEINTQALSFPYYRDVDRLKIFDNEKNLVLDYDLLDYRICVFDGLCALEETFESCPEDCQERKHFVPEEKDLTAEVLEEGVEDKVKASSLIIILVIAVLVIVIAVLFLRRQPKRKRVKIRK